MDSTCDFLVEIGTEELPPKALRKLSDAFSAGILSGLKDHDLAFSSSQSYATPRRLALVIKDLQTQQANKKIERRGPALQAAYDKAGNATKAALGFAQSCGLSIEQLVKLETDKGSWLVANYEQAGKSASEILPSLVQASLDKLPIPKRMRWGSRKTEFVRPVHWVVMLLGSEIIPTPILDTVPSNQTRGHRFHSPNPIEVPNPLSYESVLKEKGSVIANFDERKALILDATNNAARELSASAVIDPDLLDEVTSLVESPYVVVGHFDEAFLSVPQEALISSMQDHQKYFPLKNSDGKLINAFITIANIKSNDIDQVRHGNEKVIRPRLSDAKFFWDQDRKTPLGQAVEKLKSVVFQSKLGSLYDKTERVKTLAKHIAVSANLNDTSGLDIVAPLIKADLLSEMVGEFPELQGIMGSYYAEHDGVDTSLALAIQEHYLPRFAGDSLPETQSGLCLALADRLDTLVGIFAIGQHPTGDKDPFALRRASLGVIRMLIDKQISVDLKDLINTAILRLPEPVKASADSEAVWQFFSDRLKGYFSELGFSANVFESVASIDCFNLVDFNARMLAVKAFLENPAVESLSAANKRIRNILKKTNADFLIVDPSLLTEPAEISLVNQINALGSDVDTLLETRNYAGALNVLATLRDSIDGYFDAVMVMCEDEAIQKNRLATLNQISTLFMRVADISRLQQ